MEDNNLDVPTYEECYNDIQYCIDKLEEKYGYEYLCSWIPDEGIKVTVESLESLPIEMLVYKVLNGLECAFAGETGIVPQKLWQKFTVAHSNALKLI